ncbi:uncharacterized protein LOC124721418 isoform X1 [Schistocerca piceifrons]|uniref:uncharacterized protein LOC124721418 isoform X1 n=1 Tax=Schistocerca piceifrons TaxID=274613 RepID=UPI001F5E6B4B|nr:uncharacterized protein LOC124721418 isoform X1 [Schistocerca piceifrons]
MPATGSERRSSAVAGGMDTSRRLSASSDCSLPDRDRQCFQEHVETIPTRLPKLTSSKPAANPLQFIKVGPCDLYRSAQEQIRKVEEVKKIKEKRDEAEDWQSNLDNWKNSRRKRQEHIIERVVEVKKFELEEYDRNRKRSKTFNEMMEERTNRGRKVSLVVYKDDDDKDLSDLGLGANSGSRNNDSDDSEIQSMPGKEYAAESQRATIQTNNANDGQDTSLTSQESQEFTYEQAIQGYVNFAETRVKSKNSSRNEHHSVKEANCSLRSEERLNDDGKKEKTPPPVAPKPRKYSLKSEVPMTDKKSLGAEGNGCISDSTRKLSLPQVDVLKRREVFEKSSTSKDHSSKNKPAELIDTKTVKERLSSLGINSSGLSSRKKSSETEIKTSRQLQLQNPRKQPSESYINVNDDGKLEQNGDNNFGEKCYRSDSELLEESGSGLNSYDMNGNNSDNSLKERSLNSATDASTNNKFEIIADTHSKNEGYYRYEGDISDNRRTLDDTEQCWIQSDNTKHSRRKFHRSLDSLDKKYCDDVGSELLERVQSFEGLEHCNSVKDYPLSASSIEMLGSSSNGGDTDREDSGIHTADVSCSISQTDEAAEYGDPSAEISSTFSHLLLDKTAGNSDDHDVKCVAEEQAFSHFAASGAQEPNGTADTSRISLETCTSCEREEVLVSHVSTDVSSQSLGGMENSDSTVLQTDAGNYSLLHDNSICTQIVKGDGYNCPQMLQLDVDSCKEISNPSTVSAKDEEFLSDTGKEERGMQLAKSTVECEESEMVLFDPQTNSMKVSINSSENPSYETEESTKAVLTQVAQPVTNGEDSDQEIQKHEQFPPTLLKSDSSGMHLPVEFTESSDTCCTEKGDTNVNKTLSDELNNEHTQSSLAQFNLEQKTICLKSIEDESVSENMSVSDKNILLPNIINGKQCHEKADDVEQEERINVLTESSDRNSLLDTNAIDADSSNTVVAVARVTEEQKNEQDGKEQDEVLVQKIEANDVELEYGDGKCSAALSACISTKDSSIGTKESKEEMRDPACGYAEGQKDDASHENQKFLTSGLQRNDKVAETMLNDRVCVASFNELSNVVYEDHPTQKQPDLQEEPVKSFLTTEIVTKDLKNLRLSESPEKKSESFASTTAKMIESPITDTSQIIHQIPPLNLSSEIEIVAGLTFPLGPVTAAEPPKEKPPPPPPPQSDSDDEHVQRGRGLQRIDSTKRIKKEIRRKRTNFLGIEGNADDSYLEPELKVAPPPDMTTFLMEEQRLQKQLYRQSICSESDSNLGETTDSRDSGVELEKGNPDDIWVPKPSSTPDVLSLEHSRQNSEIYGTASIASEDDEIAKKEREIIETLEKEEQWQHGHSPHNHEENIGEELTEKLWQLEQDNLRLEWEKEAQRRELEETVQRREEEMRQKEREFQRHEAMLHMERTRLEREAEIIPRHKDKLPQPQQWGNKGRLSLQDISAVRHMPQKNITQFTPRSMLPEHCQSMPDLQQKRPEQEWKQQNPPKVVSTHHSQPAQQDWQEKENYSRSSWTPVFSPVTQQKDFQSSGTNHIQGQQMTRQTLQALSAVPRPRLIPTDNWIQAKRKPESKRGTFNSQHWLIQEAEQRRITEQQQRNAMASQKMPSQLSQPLLWMHQQPQQKKPLPDSVINTLTQRVQNKVDSKKYPNRTRAQDSQSREQIAGHHNILRPNGNPVTMNSDQTTEKMLSVSGKKKCSHCGEELGRGAAMIIESLRLFYHIDCFKCCVCHIQLGDGLMGTDVRVRNNKLHCHNCYSSEDGVKFSCV